MNSKWNNVFLRTFEHNRFENSIEWIRLRWENHKISLQIRSMLTSETEWKSPPNIGCFWEIRIFNKWKYGKTSSMFSKKRNGLNIWNCKTNLVFKSLLQVQHLFVSEIIFYSISSRVVSSWLETSLGIISPNLVSGLM